MSKALELALCDTQGKLFELSARRGYNSEAFVKAYMNSSVAADMDLEFHHVQWAGKEYVLARLEEECSDKLTTGGTILDEDTLYWIGYLYRYWNLYNQESSRAIYRQAPYKIMSVVYLMYHTMSPELAIERLKESK